MRFNTFFKTTLLALTVVIALAGVSFAQSKNYSKRQVSNIIADLERSSNTFRRDFNKYLDESSLNGTNEEDRINSIVSRYERALDRLRREFDTSDNWWESRNNVRSVMDEARSVNSMMNNLSFARKLENQWKNMRRDINKLADTYDLPELNTSGGLMSANVPSWAIGTWYGRNPATGGTITMAVMTTGFVTFTFENGSTSNAMMDGDRLDHNGIISKISRISNGIRTTRLDNGERIDYFNTNQNLGGGNWGTGNPPSWAVGTWYGRNPTTGGTITMMVQTNGQVTFTFDNGTTSYAIIDGDKMNHNGIISKISKISNGVRTTRQDNGERIDYFNNNQNLGGNWGAGNPPSWAVGTWYGRNPATGGTITMAVASNGNVTFTFENGTTSYASMNGDRMNHNGIISKISKISNGIRTTRQDNGERIDYYANNQNYGGTGTTGNPPSWAIGTWYGRNPATGGTITMLVQSNGQVTFTFENGTTSYATLDGDRLTHNGVVSKVTKIKNGVRTTRQDNGERIDYTR